MRRLKSVGQAQRFLSTHAAVSNGQFVDYYNHERYHESLSNQTPADVCYGRGQQILDRREQIKLNTLAMRRKMHYDNQLELRTLMS